MPNSLVEQISLNSKYVVVQSHTLENSTGKPVVYNYTWILTRGFRTYTRAYKVIKHNTFKTFMDLNR